MPDFPSNVCLSFPELMYCIAYFWTCFFKVSKIQYGPFSFGCFVCCMKYWTAYKKYWDISTPCARNYCNGKRRKHLARHKRRACTDHCPLRPLGEPLSLLSLENVTIILCCRHFAEIWLRTHLASYTKTEEPTLRRGRQDERQDQLIQYIVGLFHLHTC